MADTATLQTRLLEAELAYHKLMTGTKQVAVQQDDMQVTFNMANVDRLRSYIAEIKAQLSALGVTDAGNSGVARRVPIYIGS